MSKIIEEVIMSIVSIFTRMVLNLWDKFWLFVKKKVLKLHSGDDLKNYIDIYPEPNPVQLNDSTISVGFYIKNNTNVDIKIDRSLVYMHINSSLDIEKNNKYKVIKPNNKEYFYCKMDLSQKHINHIELNKNNQGILELRNIKIEAQIIYKNINFLCKPYENTNSIAVLGNYIK